jgi:hypothetical protein
LGDQKDLRKYREWCLENLLFINPLNDLGIHPIASHDCLNLPTIVIQFDKPPDYLNLFNQIKQEFGTARYMYHESIQGYKPHFSDEDIVLVETMETARYSFYVEQLKLAYRMSYSILDKIAFFLNDYLDLKIAEHQVSFRSLWYQDIKKKSLRPFFENSKNWALRGLYWLSRDLFEKNEDFDSVLEPDAKEIAIIRNHIEHKGLKIVANNKWTFDMYDEKKDISFVITRHNLEQKTLKLLKLARAAIMYLSFAVSHEEMQRKFEDKETLPIASGTIPHYMKS